MQIGVGGEAVIEETMVEAEEEADVVEGRTNQAVPYEAKVAHVPSLGEHEGEVGESVFQVGPDAPDGHDFRTLVCEGGKGRVCRGTVVVVIVVVQYSHSGHLEARPDPKPCCAYHAPYRRPRNHLLQRMMAELDPRPTDHHRYQDKGRAVKQSQERVQQPR